MKKHFLQIKAGADKLHRLIFYFWNNRSITEAPVFMPLIRAEITAQIGLSIKPFTRKTQAIIQIIPLKLISLKGSRIIRFKRLNKSCFIEKSYKLVIPTSPLVCRHSSTTSIKSTDFIK